VINQQGSLIKQQLRKAGINFNYIKYTIYHLSVSAKNVSSDPVIKLNESQQFGHKRMIYWHTGIHDGQQYCTYHGGNIVT